MMESPRVRHSLPSKRGYGNWSTNGELELTRVGGEKDGKENEGGGEKEDELIIDA